MKYALKPYVLGLRVTERCNVACCHCALSATPRGADMPISRASRAIEQAAAWGIRLLHISGGEPLLYKDIAAVVSGGCDAGMFVEMVTSTFSTPESEQDDLRLLHRAAEAGLGRVLLSYDDGHARRVEFKRFARFAVAARDLGLDICIYGLEARHFVITVEQIRLGFAEAGIDVDSVDWVSAKCSRTGRGEAVEADSCSLTWARCPYVMPVPTLVPDGRVLLCPCAVLSAPSFVIGYQASAGLGPLLNRLQSSPFYRFLALYGPQGALRMLGVPEDCIPTEICKACDRYLGMAERSVQEKISTIDLSNVAVDYEALRPPHQRFLDQYVGRALSTTTGA